MPSISELERKYFAGKAILDEEKHDTLIGAWPFVAVAVSDRGTEKEVHSFSIAFPTYLSAGDGNNYEAVMYHDAKHWVINHLDCSKRWLIMLDRGSEDYANN